MLSSPYILCYYIWCYIEVIALIEKEIFRKSLPNYDQLLDYGFVVDHDDYVYFKKIESNSFEIKVVISCNEVKGFVYDLDMNEEYTSFRIENTTGEFAGRIRKQFIDLLIDIRAHCFNVQYFVGSQANRISQMILNRFGDAPFFEWESTPDFGVFKNKNNMKWYGLIMNINAQKFGLDDQMIDVINLKLDPNHIQQLLKEDGYYPAYHMNKKYWLSVFLDDTLSDDDIFSLIEESYSYTVRHKGGSWLVPANPHYYDIEKAFQSNNIIRWKQSSNIQVGEIVYIYVGKPVSAILYKCLVKKNNIPYESLNSNVKIHSVMEIEKLETYSKDLFPFSILQQYGVKAIRGPRSMTQELEKYIIEKTR